jgi:L-rhamnose mutarotase
MSKRYCLALDLKNDPRLIQEYEQHHKAVWPEIIQSIRGSGINNMEIYRVENRLFMIMEVNDSFSFDKKRQSDESNPKVQDWENLMWNYQQAISGTGKWILMNKIFDLKEF